MYRLTESLPYLLNRVGVRIGELLTRELTEAGLTLSGFRVLASLWERGDQRLSDLAMMAGVEISTLSRLVGLLKRQRLVTRRRAGEDGREVRINLTPEGHEMIERLIPRAEFYTDVGLGNFTADQIAMLKQLLTQVADNLTAFDEAAPKGKRTESEAA
jgi:DNA-binding MarR family transcriptional regulator